MKGLFRHSKGIGLVEILITMGVLAVGVLGVAGLNSVISRQSQENKAQAEALAIAQGYIEQVRNYTDSVASLADFNGVYPDTQGFEFPQEFDGINASFVRSEQWSSAGDAKVLNVQVVWTDVNGVAQNVTLDTELAYESPRSKGDRALSSVPELVNAPTGRARLGEGTLDEDIAISQGDNGDGTELFKEGEDLKLVVEDEEGVKQIVLTLALACQSEEGCKDFVTIKGRVYSDTNVSGQPQDLKTIYLAASDAAYCARYFYDANGAFHKIDEYSTSYGEKGVYEYFDYTCYLGGGWHGNVGIIFAGNNTSAKFKACVGDPLATDDDDKPSIAIRRAYRGMLHKFDGSTNSGYEEVPTANGGTKIKYYSIGIKDSAFLPDPDDDSEGDHDFVIGDVDTNAECMATMKKTGSEIGGIAGALFANVPDEFVCLNNGNLDLYDGDEFGEPIGGECPYDPTHPPAYRHILSGTVTFTGPETGTNDDLVDSISVATSDGASNCAAAAPLTWTHLSGVYTSSVYKCDVYDWGTGWNGSVNLSYIESGMTCTPKSLTFTNVTSGSSGHNFSNCRAGVFAVISGTVSQVGGGPKPAKRLLEDGTGAVMSGGGTCTVANGGLSYTCTTAEFTGNWTGTVTFKAFGTSKVCPSPFTGIVSFSNLLKGDYTSNLKITRDTGDGC